MNRVLRVVLIANTAWYLRNFRGRLVERLEAHGYELVLVAPADEEVDKPFFRERDFRALTLSRKGRNPFAELLALFRIIRLLRREQPDAVLTWTPKPNIYGAIAGRLLSIPVVPNVAGLGFAFIGNGWLPWLVSGLYRSAFRRCSIVFFQNNDDRDQLVSAGCVNDAAARLLPGSGVDLARFQPQLLRSGSEFVFLFVGRLIADKGLRVLMEAAERLRNGQTDLVVRIVGFTDSGNPAAISNKEIRDWEARGLAEHVGQTDSIETVIAGADCVVLPSYYREGVPRSLLEAAASARPVITTDATGCREAVIDGETGYLCQPRDVDSLVDAMARVLALTPGEREAMGQAGRTYMERRFAESNVLEAYETALAECI